MTTYGYRSGDLVIFDNMLGRTMTHVTGGPGDEEMVFTSTDGSKFRFYHEPDCCESVQIDDVCGDLSDLVGSPIVQAEEVSSEGTDPPECDGGSHTWTFYRFATAKGSVTVRWLGESNGYYSEDVEYEEIITTPPPEPEKPPRSLPKVGDRVRITAYYTEPGAPLSADSLGDANVTRVFDDSFRYRLDGCNYELTCAPGCGDTWEPIDPPAPIGRASGTYTAEVRVMFDSHPRGADTFGENFPICIDSWFVCSRCLARVDRCACHTRGQE